MSKDGTFLVAYPDPRVGMNWYKVDPMIGIPRVGETWRSIHGVYTVIDVEWSNGEGLVARPTLIVKLKDE